MTEALMALAKIGAERRLVELKEEVAAIVGSFPEFAQNDGGTPTVFEHAVRAELKRDTLASSDGGATTNGRRSFTPAQRRAASRRMKAYWAGRKAAKKTTARA